MAGPPKLERTDRCHQNVQDERGRPNDRRRKSKQSHGRDVTGRARVSDRGIEKRDHRDRETKKNEQSCVHLSIYEYRGGRRGDRLFIRFGA